MCQHTSKFCFALAVMLFAIAAMNDGVGAQGKIIITALPSNPAPRKGEVTEVPMIIDMSQTQFRLGGIATGLQWDVTQLAFEGFAPGTTEGFSDPVVNTKKTADGKLIFASLNAKGAIAQVNVLTLRFQAKVDITAWQGLKLDLTTLAAAESFVDLLPLVEQIITSVRTAENTVDLPTTFALYQNVPNPYGRLLFNPVTMIRYELPKIGQVVLTIYNLNGQKIKTLEDENKLAGRYAVLWNGRDERDQNVASGIYFYRLEVLVNHGEKFVATRKMSLLR